jgi:hypothetical protein
MLAQKALAVKAYREALEMLSGTTGGPPQGPSPMADLARRNMARCLKTASARPPSVFLSTSAGAEGAGSGSSGGWAISAGVRDADKLAAFLKQVGLASQLMPGLPAWQAVLTSSCGDSW